MRDCQGSQQLTATKVATVFHLTARPSYSRAFNIRMIARAEVRCIPTSLTRETEAKGRLFTSHALVFIRRVPQLQVATALDYRLERMTPTDFVHKYMLSTLVDDGDGKVVSLGTHIL